MKYLKGFNKKIKGFKQFMSLIKENVNYWNSDIDEEFSDYLIELADEGFEIGSADEGFVDCLNPPKKEEGDPNQLKLFPTDEIEIDDDLIGDAESFGDDGTYIVLPGLICPAYKFTIGESDSSDGNFTDALLFFRKIVLSELGLQTVVLVDGEAIDFKYVKVEDGQFHIREYDDEELGYTTYDSIDLVVMSSKPIEFKMKDVAEYYSWKHYELDKSGNITFKVDLEDMASIICDDSGQEDIINNGYMDEDLYYRTERVDVDSLVRYNLTSEAEKMLAKCIIIELGGVKNIDGLEEMTEEEAIGFLTSENYRRKLISLAEDSTICDDLRDIYDDYESNAQISANYDALFVEFEEVMDKYFNYKYNSKDRKYIIEFKEDWMLSLINDHEFDYDYFRSESPEGIMREWFMQENNSETLVPRDSHGDVDEKRFSADAISCMQNFLNNFN